MSLFTDILSRELPRYIVAGSVAFAVDFSVLYVFTEFVGLHYLISNLLSNSCGFVVVYTLNTRWVFSYRKYDQTTTEVSIFIVIVVIGVGVNELILALIVEEFSQSYLIAKLWATGVVFMFNFVARRYFLFSQ